MAAAPKNASLVVIGKVSGKRVPIDVYLSDVNAARANYSQGGAAGSTGPDFINVPEESIIVDFAVETAPTDTKSVGVYANDRFLYQLRYANQLAASYGGRPALAIPLHAGDKLTMVQSTA